MPLLEYRQVLDAAAHGTKDLAPRGAVSPMPSAPHAALPSWIPFSPNPSALAHLQAQQGSAMLPNALMFGANPHASTASPTSVAVADAYAFTYCPICNQFGHWYSRCELFNGSVLLFFNERDQRPYLMQHFNWMQEATLRDVFQFLRVSTGLAPRQYQLLVHGSTIPMHDRRTRCCDVGLLPGAMVRVQLAADQQFLAMMPSAQYFGQVRHAQNSPQATAQSIPCTTTCAPDAAGHVDRCEPRGSAKPCSDGTSLPRCVAHEMAPDAPIATDLHAVESPASVHTPDMSGISVASTSLLRSVPGATDATHDTAPTPERGDTLPTNCPAEVADTATEPEADGRPSNNDGAAASCGKRQHEVDVPSVERPQDVSRWADLSVASSLGKRSRSPNLTDQASPPPQTRGARTLYREHPSESSVSKSVYRGGPPVACATAHVKFLPSTMTFAAMRDMFFSVGEVVRVRVVDADSSIPIEKRFAMAFVEYHYPESVDRLIAAFHRARVGTFVLAVTRSMNAIKGKYHTDATRSTPCTFGLRSHAPVGSLESETEVGSPDRAKSQQTPQRAKLPTTVEGSIASRRLGAPQESRPRRSATACSALESTPPVAAPRGDDESPTAFPGVTPIEKSASHCVLATGGYKLAPRLGDLAIHRGSPAVPVQDPIVTSPDVAHRLSMPPTQATSSGVAFAAARLHTVTASSGSTTLSDGSRSSGADAPTSGGRVASLFTLRLPELREFVKLRELVHEFVADRVQASYFRALRFTESLRAPPSNPTLKVDLLLLQCALHRCHGGKVSNTDAAVAARATVAEGAACYNAYALSGSTASHVQWCMAVAAALVEDIVEVAELEVMLMTALRLSGPDAVASHTDAALVERLRKAQRAVRKHHNTFDRSSERPSETPLRTPPLHGIVAATCFSHGDGVAVSETLLTMAY